MKLKIKKDNMKSAVFIALSLILMASSLYVGLVRGRVDDGMSANTDDISYGIEDLVGKNDSDKVNTDDGIPKVPDKEGTDSPDEISQVVSEDAEDDIGDIVQDVSASANDIKLSRPVSADRIVMDYSYDTDPVYSKTFNEYRSDHTGVDYAAKDGEEVFAAAEGKVSDLYEDERLGFTVVVAHEGFETRYSNLQRGMLVSVGDEVTPETALGRVGSSAIYESGEDSHVHFSVYVDGKCVDPKEYF
ncbi:MAG: M23 family metallopeptidase [Eubacteriaceae bacterium]|nr:M23 family metallopeptidase [Eubacteriaceae bacterium]